MLAGAQIHEPPESAGATDLDAMSRYAEMEALERAHKQAIADSADSSQSAAGQKRKAAVEITGMPSEKSMKVIEEGSARHAGMLNADELDI